MRTGNKNNPQEIWQVSGTIINDRYELSITYIPFFWGYGSSNDLFMRRTNGEHKLFIEVYGEHPCEDAYLIDKQFADEAWAVSVKTIEKGLFIEIEHAYEDVKWMMGYFDYGSETITVVVEIDKVDNDLEYDMIRG